jgi:hypothetical protein
MVRSFVPKMYDTQTYPMIGIKTRYLYLDIRLPLRILNFVIAHHDPSRAESGVDPCGKIIRQPSFHPSR